MKSPINYTYYPVKRIFRSTKIIDILKKREQVTGIEVFFRLMQYYFGVAYYPAIGTKYYQNIRQLIQSLKDKRVITKKIIRVRPFELKDSFIQNVYLSVYNLWRLGKYGKYNIYGFNIYVIDIWDYLDITTPFFKKEIFRYLTTGLSKASNVKFLCRGYRLVEGYGRHLRITDKGKKVLYYLYDYLKENKLL